MAAATTGLEGPYRAVMLCDIAGSDAAPLMDNNRGTLQKGGRERHSTVCVLALMCDIEIWGHFIFRCIHFFTEARAPLYLPLFWIWDRLLLYNEEGALCQRSEHKSNCAWGWLHEWVNVSKFPSSFLSLPFSFVSTKCKCLLCVRSSYPWATVFTVKLGGCQDVSPSMSVRQILA